MTYTIERVIQLTGCTVIDSRDVIEFIDWATGEAAKGNDIGRELRIELNKALVLHKIGQESAEDWTYGVPLIRDSYFREYAMELADDCGMIPDNLTWPLSCIDWDQAARELQMDYTPIDWDGTTYWVR